MTYIEIIIIMLILFISAILITVLVKQCSVKEATILCRDFIKDIFKALCAPTPPPEVIYPTLVGYENGHFVPQFIDESFSKVCSNFAVCYCVGAEITADGSCALYTFSIQRKLDCSLGDADLAPLIQKEAEEVLTKTMRLYDCYLPAEPLTVIDLSPTTLRVAFARSEAGLKAIEGMKHSARKRRHISTTPDNKGSMTEKWKEEDDERR